MVLAIPLPRRTFRIGFAAHLGLVILIATGAYLGILPTSLPQLPHFDLLGHAVLIGGLAFFLDGALGLRPLVRGVRFPRLAPVIVLAVAGVEEYAQRLSSRRTSSWSDYAADVAGVLFFSWLAARLSAKPPERSPQPTPT
jgi:polysaccharide biosynthesis protein VpsQ